MFQRHQSKTPNFAYSSLWHIYNRVYIQSFYTNRWRNHGSVCLNCSLENNWLLTSIIHLLCGHLSFAGGSDSTSVRTVYQHLTQVGFTPDNEIPLYLNNFKQCWMPGKNKGHRPADINPEAIFVVLASIPSLQSFDRMFITFFSLVVVTSLSNMISETQRFNNDLNGFKTAISYDWIKFVALSCNRTNMA